MKIRLLITIWGYPAGAVLDVGEALGEFCCAWGVAESVPVEPTITMHDDGHRTIEVTVRDNVALVDG